MPATAAPAHVPAVDQPGHPLPALATFELAGYRRQLENARQQERAGSCAKSATARRIWRAADRHAGADFSLRSVS